MVKKSKTTWEMNVDDQMNDDNELKDGDGTTKKSW